MINKLNWTIKNFSLLVHCNPAPDSTSAPRGKQSITDENTGSVEGVFWRTAGCIGPREQREVGRWQILSVITKLIKI